MKSKSKTSYSWRTSLPAYLENLEGKDMQEKLVLHVMKKKRGKSTLKEVQDYLRTIFRITLPQSTISGRMNDLRDKGYVGFYGETKVYRDRIRKVFEVVKGRKHRKKAIKKGTKIVYRYKPSEPKSVRHNKILLFELPGGSLSITLKNGSAWKTFDGNTWIMIKKSTQAKKKLTRKPAKKRK